MAPGATAHRLHSGTDGSVSHRAAAAQARRGPHCLLGLVVVALMWVSIVFLSGCTAPETVTTVDSTTALPSPTGTGQAPSQSAPVQRALQNLVSYHRFAFSITTWDVSRADSPVVFQIEGVMVDPWTYLHISGPGLQEQVEVVYQSQAAWARVGDAVSWTSAAEVFASVAGLDAAPIENPEPLKEVVPGIAALAQPATSGTPPLPAPPEPAGATSYEWSTSLTADGVERGTVHNRIWLNDKGVLIRWDRRLTPSAAGEQLAATYSSITYTQHGDAGLTIPAQGYEAAGDTQTR